MKYVIGILFLNLWLLFIIGVVVGIYYVVPFNDSTKGTMSFLFIAANVLIFFSLGNVVEDEPKQSSKK